jgi:hypothetical protein
VYFDTCKGFFDLPHTLNLFVRPYRYYRVRFLVLMGQRPHAATHPQCAAGKRLPVTTQQSVTELIAAGQIDSVVSASCSVDRHTVAKLRLSLEYWGQCYPPYTVRLGRPPLLQQAQIEGLAKYLKGRPSAYLDKMQLFLYKDYDVIALLPTV